MRVHIIIIATVLVLFYSCHSEEATAPSDGPSPKELRWSTVDVSQWRKEALDIDSLRFDQRLYDDKNLVFDFENDKNLVVKHPRINLSNQTTIEEFARLYPESSKLHRKSGYLWRGVVKVFASEKEGDLDFWLAEFRHEKLSKLSLYTLRRRPDTNVNQQRSD